MNGIINAILNAFWLCACAAGAAFILWLPILCVPLAFAALFFKWLYTRKKGETLASFWGRHKFFFAMCIIVTWIRNGPACACFIAAAWWAAEYTVKIMSK